MMPEPIRNMRVTFWGSQGSVAVFPDPSNIQAFARQVAVHAILRVFEDWAARAAEAACTPADLLGAPPSPSAVIDYQQRIGLPTFPVYSGETTCVEVRTADGEVIIFDAGSGLRRCSRRLLESWDSGAARRIHLFVSHAHLDHRNGFSFAQFLFARPEPFRIDIYSTGELLRALDAHYGLFSHTLNETLHSDDPIDYRIMSAEIAGHEIIDPGADLPVGDVPWARIELLSPIQIGPRTRVQPFEVYHVSTRCLGYKLTYDGSDGPRSFVFCTDHERRHGGQDDRRQQRAAAAEARVIQHSMGADLAYYDGQYFLAEYMGLRGIGSTPALPRLDWGHTCIEDIVERSQRCDVKHSVIGHFDPERDWVERLQMDTDMAARFAGTATKIEMAKGDMTVEL